MTGVTTLSSGHRLGSIEDTDLVVLLESGCVVDVEVHRQLRRSSSLYRSLLAG
jgi:ABC-type transport system involved in Fe-S cluster assembly fused permease/ATPase subunit